MLFRSAKASKMEQWRSRRVAPEAKQQFVAASALFLSQVSQFLYQVPVSVAAKEISRGASCDLVVLLSFRIKVK